jgi:hypothetical protein
MSSIKIIESKAIALATAMGHEFNGRGLLAGRYSGLGERYRRCSRCKRKIAIEPKCEIDAPAINDETVFQNPFSSHSGDKLVIVGDALANRCG